MGDEYAAISTKTAKICGAAAAPCSLLRPAASSAPAGKEPVKTSKGDMLAYHYYDGEEGGVAKLQLSPLSWTSDGWPELGPLPQ